MPIDAILTLTIFFGVVVTLISNRISADLVLMAALTALVVLGILSPEKALSGFASPGILTIACLYVIAAGLMETGAIHWLSSLLFGTPSSIRAAQFRLFLPTSILSAVTNNTAVVAMFIPAVQEWADRLKIQPSKLLIPLSYTAILGGTCTLIGTSTNLIIDSFLQTQYSYQMGLMEIAVVGVPITLVGWAYLIIWGAKILPNRGRVTDQIDELREYCVEFSVEVGGALVDKSILAAGLRNLKSGYLMELRRTGSTLGALSPNWSLQSGDTLVFIGAPNLSSELRKIRGLVPVDHQMGELGIENSRRCLVEVVLGAEFPGIGRTIKESKFRSRYNAVVLSLSRDGQRQPGKLGELEFKVGDMLLLEADFDFVDQFRFRKDFLLVSQLNNSTPPDHKKAPYALGILLVMIVATVSGLVSILEAVLLGSGAMLLFRCVTATKARRQIDLKVLTVIAGAFALGAAMKDTGAAQIIANAILPMDATPFIALLIIYILTVVFTEVITNNAAAILMFPIAQTYSEQLNVSILPFAVAIMIGASASFITPLGYQTNMMVYGPGQYRYMDFVKVGFPLSLLVGGVALCIIPWFWPFIL